MTFRRCLILLFLLNCGTWNDPSASPATHWRPTRARCSFVSFYIMSGTEGSHIFVRISRAVFNLKETVKALRDRKHAQAVPRSAYRERQMVHMNSSPLYRWHKHGVCLCWLAGCGARDRWFEPPLGGLE
uniref:Secreted protein n=1 Tax=Rhipicephalus zambeziensis TaxID=60191 RepID=A0A224YHE6_9ACAR